LKFIFYSRKGFYLCWVIKFKNVIMYELIQLVNANGLVFTDYTKEALHELIEQLEDAMTEIIKEGDRARINKLNELIGGVIDLYLSK